MKADRENFVLVFLIKKKEIKHNACTIVCININICIYIYIYMYMYMYTYIYLYVQNVCLLV